MSRCHTAKHRRLMQKQRANRVQNQKTATAAKQESMVAQAIVSVPAPTATPLLPARPICPLCKNALTVFDNIARNFKVVNLNGRLYPVHKTCPEVKP